MKTYKLEWWGLSHWQGRAQYGATVNSFDGCVRWLGLNKRQVRMLKTRGICPQEDGK